MNCNEWSTHYTSAKMADKAKFLWVFFMVAEIASLPNADTISFE
jgi:hypothetical protein